VVDHALFLQVIALLGGFTVTILSFILPSYLHLQIVGYQSITGGKGEAGLGGSKIAYSDQERAGIVRTDIFLTVAGTLLCVIATAVTTIGFLSRVGSNGGQCT
jgi:amino acid permease